MGHMRRIDVWLDQTPAAVEYPTQLDNHWITGIVPVARGPVRLVIDMPARSARILFTALCAAVGSFAILAIELSLLFAFDPPNSGSPVGVPPVMAAAAVSSAAFFFMLWLGRAGVARERLEIDSRFVTLARGGGVIATFPRGMCNVFSLAERPRPGLDSWFARRFHDFPQLRFGSDSAWHITAGAGISHATALRLATAIREFISEHPPENG